MKINTNIKKVQWVQEEIINSVPVNSRLEKLAEMRSFIKNETVLSFIDSITNEETFKLFKGLKTDMLNMLHAFISTDYYMSMLKSWIDEAEKEAIKIMREEMIDILKSAIYENSNTKSEYKEAFKKADVYIKQEYEEAESEEVKKSVLEVRKELTNEIKPSEKQLKKIYSNLLQLWKSKDEASKTFEIFKKYKTSKEASDYIKQLNKELGVEQN